MIRYLQNDLKQQIEVKVNLSYSFQMKYSGDILRIADILKEYGLQPVVSDGQYYGPCKDLKCKGSVDLLTAEIISRRLNLIPTHSNINYRSDGSFSLTA